MARSKHDSKTKSTTKSDSTTPFKLVGSDKEPARRSADAADREEPLHFPESTPWGAPKDQQQKQAPANIIDSIERQIDRAQESLDRLSEDADVLFRIDSDEHDDTPSAA